MTDIQKRLLDMMNAFHDICAKENLRYFDRRNSSVEKNIFQRRGGWNYYKKYKQGRKMVY